MDWLNDSVKSTSCACIEQAEARQAILTKPAGALGRLESLAINLAGLLHTQVPTIDRVLVSVFAADHGIAAEGVSAYPQAVTAQMIANFLAGGAAISVASRAIGAHLEVVNLGTVAEVPEMTIADTDSNRYVESVIASGTRPFHNQPAMTHEQLIEAFDAGKAAADRASEISANLFIGGEMGIGNTTSASALAAALLAIEPSDIVGRGTGVDNKGVEYKATVIAQALTHHGLSDSPNMDQSSAIERLIALGGFEIAALVAAYIRCAQLGIPVLVDGFICSVAALYAAAIQPQSRRWMLFSHRSAEQGHTKVLQALTADPLLDLSMRLGEASGAAVAVPLLRIACDLHNQMATFEQANVDTSS